jgi:mannose-6-phosphate isomerase-like protein (cupin superfamily)
MKTLFWLATVLALAGTTMPSTAQPTQSSATFIESNKVAAAFAKGMPLLENGEYKIHASRRDAPGVAEIHTKDTDIIHVLEGAAILVTGGTVAEPKTIAPDEIRGKEIKGGESRRIGKGAVIVVPNGVPHWFQEVDAPLLYYVVKVSSTSPAK